MVPDGTAGEARGRGRASEGGLEGDRGWASGRTGAGSPENEDGSPEMDPDGSAGDARGRVS